jgi:hypothetical protein
MTESLGDPKDEAPVRQEKEDDYHPSRVQEVFRHRFLGYVLSYSAQVRSHGTPGQVGELRARVLFLLALL